MTEDRQLSTRRPVTRADVARYAGVSTAVVSYVVNNGPRPVAAPTAARVREAIDLLGYRPNISARALKGGSTRILGLVTSDIANPFFAEYALRIQAEADDRGYAVIMANAHGDPDTEHQVVEDLVSRQVDGLLVASVDARAVRFRHLRSLGVSTVLIDTARPVRGFRTIGPDAVAGARLAVEHLVGHGHRSVALVIGPTRGGPDPREQGWQAATRAAGLPDGPIARTDFSREGGYDAGRRLLDTPHPPTAIFASSDLQGVGVLRAVRECGLRAPEDVAVAAFDGSTESEFTWPALTVARQPIDAMAERAVAAVLAPTIEDPAHESFGMSLVVRRSCGCPP